MHHGSMDQKKEHFAAKYPDFANGLPTLFQACLDPMFKLEYLRMMLHKRREINQGQVSLDQADEEVYERLKQRYLYPVLEKLPPHDAK